jgi:hypothetical protein
MTDTHYAAVLIEADSTCRDVAVSRDRYPDDLRALVGGDIEYAYYGTRKSVVCVVVHETSMKDGMPVNAAATEFVEAMRGGALSYSLHGPVAVLDYQAGADEMGDVTAFQRALLGEITSEERAA